MREVHQAVVMISVNIILASTRTRARTHTHANTHLTSLSRTILVVDVELAEVARVGGATVAVRERAQRLEALGHGGGEAPLARQLRDQEHVLRRVHLVRAVRTTCEKNTLYSS